MNAITLHKLPVSSCNLIVVFMDEFDVDLCVTFLNFQTSSRSSCLVKTITLQELPVSFHNFRDILHIKISDKFDVDVWLTF